MIIKDLHIIITGAAAGFGKSMAEYFLSQGAVVHALDIDEKSLDVLKKENNTSLFVYNCDVSDHKNVEQVVTTVFENDDKINVLINNAGIMKNAPIFNLLSRPDGKHPIDLWSQVISINQNGVFFMTRAVVERMIKNRTKGVLIHLSSIAAQGNIGQTAYSASKSAVEAMSKTWSKELGSFGIRSVCVAPGFMNTIGGHDALEEKMLANWVSKTPLKRTGEIDEVVQAVEFCCRNDFLNGEVINVNGGLSI